MKKIICGVLFAVMLVFSGCKGMNETINLKDCEYSFDSVSDVSISGVDVSNGVTPALIPVVLAVLNGDASTIPLNFTVNVGVKNPNSDAASFYSMLYRIYIDGVLITDDEITEPFRVEAGQSKTLSVPIGVDIMDLIEENTRPVVENMIKNFLGIGDTPDSKITIEVKPSFKVLDITFSAPDYISIDFMYTGNK
ncbi:MAG: LEA type 2 family protein [Tannerella sp.]|jgi:LEA14-like dessication related protein|nr:LEA type 2 family protein [Tannerella sp.]